APATTAERPAAEREPGRPVAAPRHTPPVPPRSTPARGQQPPTTPVPAGTGSAPTNGSTESGRS
ncbi:hypothetical protein, partial [Modestobacter roseus]|uniref:hypothetical protein n=1 Tax=Modestobacter roseus TaxID=1181884 RepID=UPI0034DE8743